MSPRFVMRDAIHALRATSGESPNAEATRRRIVGTVVHKKRARRQVIALVLFTFVGLPLGTTAYAAFFGTPAFVQQVIDRVVALKIDTPSVPAKQRDVRGAPAVVQPAIPQTITAPIAPPVTAPNPIAAHTPVDTAETIPSSVSSSRAPIAATTKPAAVSTRRDPPTTASDKAEITRAPVSDPSDSLYARAHELHFVTRDPAAALAAWDVYLAQAPSTTLLPEAKYNRALCLVRLHRNRDAIEALTPFSNGTFGSYRKREATALLQALAR